jgi:protein-disulfide isomerase
MMRWMALVIAIVSCGCSAPSAAPTPAARVAPPVPTAPLPLPTATAVPVVLEPRTSTGDYFLGSTDAPVTFEMFGDFQCPACGEFARSIEPPFKQQYVDTGKVRFVWHDFPWIGDESFDAAQAARCAGKQGRFWDFHDFLYGHQRGENAGQFLPANLEAFAANLGLDQAPFKACFESAQDLPAINDALRFGVNKGVDVTPTFLINGDLKVGAPPMNRLAGLMEYYLARSGR